MKNTDQPYFKRVVTRALSFFVLATILVSCVSPEEQDEKIYIALSKASPAEHYSQYTEWLQNVDTSVIYVDMYHLPMDSAMEILHECSGLVLTGGPDIYPGRYGREEDTALCGTIDHYRDTLEMALMKTAQDMKMPVLGICRGAQFINVFFGGSLVADIPSQTEGTVEHRCEDPAACFHEIKVLESSLLRNITLEDQGSVNSNHHQALKDIAPNLLVTAKTGDDLPEAVEWKESIGRPFLLGVQWHPERMDFSSAFSGPIAETFIKKSKEYKQFIEDEVNYERR